MVDEDTLPQTLAVLRTRAEPLGIGLHVADLSAGWPADLPEAGAFGDYARSVYTSFDWDAEFPDAPYARIEAAKLFAYQRQG